MHEDKKSWKFLTPLQWLKKLRAVRPWLCSGRKGLFILALLLTALLLPSLWSLWFAPPSKNWLRYYGLSVQLLGFVIALYGVNSNLQQLGLRSIPSRIWKFLREMPISPIEYKNTHTASANVSVDAPAGFMKASGTKKGGSQEERLARLEKSYEILLKKINDFEQQVEFEKQQTWGIIEKNRRDSERADNDVRSSFSQVFEGGISNEVLGIFLFIVGSVYATTPDLVLFLHNQ